MSTTLVSLQSPRSSSTQPSQSKALMLRSRSTSRSVSCDSNNSSRPDSLQSSNDAVSRQSRNSRQSRRDTGGRNSQSSASVTTSVSGEQKRTPVVIPTKHSSKKSSRKEATMQQSTRNKPKQKEEVQTRDKTKENGSRQDEKRKTFCKDVKRISELVSLKLECYMNIERREQHFSVQGSYPTTRKMHEYDLSYKVIENGLLDQKNLRRKGRNKGDEVDSKRSKTCILPRLCINSRRVVLSTEADVLTMKANTIFEEAPMEKLTVLHRYRPYSRRRKCTENGSVQNYTRHVMNALQVGDYVEWYKQQGLDSGSADNPRMQALQEKREKQEKSKDRKASTQQQKRLTHRRASTSTGTSYSQSFASETNSSDGSVCTQSAQDDEHDHQHVGEAGQTRRGSSGYESSRGEGSRPSSGQRISATSSRPSSAQNEHSHMTNRSSQSVRSDASTVNGDQPSVNTKDEENRSFSPRPPSGKSGKSARSSVSTAEGKQESQEEQTQRRYDDEESDNNEPATVRHSEDSKSHASSRPASAASRQEYYATVEHSVEGSMASLSRKNSQKSLRSASSSVTSRRTSASRQPEADKEGVGDADSNAGRCEDDDGDDGADGNSDIDIKDDSSQQLQQQQELQPDSVSTDAGDAAGEDQESNIARDADDGDSDQGEDDSETKSKEDVLGSKPPKDYISVKPKEKDTFYDK